MLTGAITCKWVEPVRWRVAQIVDGFDPIKQRQFCKRPLLNVSGELATDATQPDAFGFLAGERSDHGLPRLNATSH